MFLICNGVLDQDNFYTLLGNLNLNHIDKEVYSTSYLFENKKGSELTRYIY